MRGMISSLVNGLCGACRDRESIRPVDWASRRASSIPNPAPVQANRLAGTPAC